METKARGVLLITGGAGFIGSHTARAALEAGWSVRVLDNLTTGSLLALKGLDVEFIEGDIRDQDDLNAAFLGTSHVIHLAARISVAESCADPVGYDEVNVGGTVRVLQTARLQGCESLVYASSAAVYGSDPGLPKTRSSRLLPESPYASQKLANEAYASAFSAISDLRVTGLRYFNVFGPGQDPNGPYGAVIPSFVRAAVDGRDLHVHGDGLQSRDFISVHDVASANLAALDATSGGPFNVGVGDGLTIKDLADLVLTEVRGKSRVVYGPARPGDVRHSIADISDTIEALGWRPKQNFKDALTETVRHFHRLGTIT